MRGTLNHKEKMTIGDWENVKEEEARVQLNKSGKLKEGRVPWCWAPAANVASLMCLAHCAKLHKLSLSP